jgi:ribose transport system ATP-binding protein
MEAALHVANLSKTFGGSRVLRNVEITIGRGEIHGVLGQNGCGKSTFVKLLAGFHHPDPGSRAELFGRTISLPLAPDESRRSGLSFVHQNLGLVPSLSVLENLRIAELTAPRRWHIDWRGERRAAAEVFARIGVDIDPMARIADLSAVDRALLAIGPPGNTPACRGSWCWTNRLRSSRMRASKSCSRCCGGSSPAARASS